MKSWSKRELALAVLVIFAAVIAPYVVTRSLGRLLPGSATLFLLFLYAWVAALVTGVPFFPVGPEGAASLALDPGAGGLPGAAPPFGSELEHHLPSGGGGHRLSQQ